MGANAFAHESGIHQDGMLKNKLTYEIIAPETIGYFRGEGDVGVVMGRAAATRPMSACTLRAYTHSPHPPPWPGHSFVAYFYPYYSIRYYR